MKCKNAAVVAMALLNLAIAAMAAYMWLPTPRVGGDFRMRINEVRCLDSGVDPSAVYRGEVQHSPYVAYGSANLTAAEAPYQVNGYPPWTYLLIEPFSRLPTQWAWYLYFAVNLLILGGVFAVGRRYLRERTGDASAATLLSAVAMGLLVPSIGSCFQSGNYPIVVLGATVAMALCLERGHSVLAGLCWAVAMLKPQLAIIFAIPLLLRKRFLTVAVAGVVCLAATVYPWWRCGVDPVTLIRTSVSAGAAVFWGCGTAPYVFAQKFGIPIAAAMGLVVGLLLAGWLTWRTDRSRDWFAYLAPSAFVATVWSYSPLYNTVMIWFLAVALLPAIWRRGEWFRRHWLLTGLGVIALSRVYTFAHGFVMLLPASWQYSTDLHGHFDWFSQLLAIGFVIGVWNWHAKMGKRRVCGS